MLAQRNGITYDSVDITVNQNAKLYDAIYVKLSKDSVPSNLAVGDKFIYTNAGLEIVGVQTSYDLTNTRENPTSGIHVGAQTIPTHDAQSFCLYNGSNAATTAARNWFKDGLNKSESADPGNMVQMTVANMTTRANYNGVSVNLRANMYPNSETARNHIFGYLTTALGSVKSTTTPTKTLNLENTNILLSCMHAWANESDTTPQDILKSISDFTGRGDYAEDKGCGHYLPNIALQCTEVKDDTAKGYTYATFKVVTSMLEVGGIAHPQNYQCAFATLRIAYENPKTGYLKIHKTSSNTALTDGNSSYTFNNIEYGIYKDKNCTDLVKTVTLDKDGNSTPVELDVATYYVKEISVPSGCGYKQSGEVYDVDVTTSSTSTSPAECNPQDEPLNDPFGIVINKINSNTKDTTADMSGAEYTIKFYAGKYSSISSLPTPTHTWVIKTVKNASGQYHAMLDDTHIVSGSAKYGKAGSVYIIPLGTITVEETKAPVGFTTKGATVQNAKNSASIEGTNGVYLFQLMDSKSSVYIKNGNHLNDEASDEAAMTLKYYEVQNKAGITITKRDAATSGTASGNASFAGIKFAIINSTGASITNAAGNIVKDGAVAQVITTDATGVASTGKTDLPVGKYTVKELRSDATFDGTNFKAGTSTNANGSYQWKENAVTVTIKDANANTLVSAGTVYDNPITAVPRFEKHDSELAKKVPMKGTSFEGITFEIYNDSTNPVVVNGTSHNKGTVVATAKSDKDGNFAFTTGLPVGKYYVKEKQANDYYVTSNQTRSFEVLEGGTIQYETGFNAVIISDQVVRGDFTFSKKNADTGAALAYVPFKITNVETGETHYILTDANGNFSSITGKTTNTNANDAVLSKYTEKDVIPQGVISSLKKDAGVWFGLGSDGTMTTAKESYGSLVYGTYTLTELKTTDTKPMTMVTRTITIKQNVYTENLGDLQNIPVKISTTLTDDDGDHYAKADSRINLTDVITYKDLPKGKTYSIKATLYVKDGSTLTKLTENTATITPTSSNGSTQITFSNVDTTGLAGKSLVCFEELTLDGAFIAEHVNPDDEGQTVHFPSVGTSAVANSTKDHVGLATNPMKITDTVTIKSLKVGETYSVRATLMNRATGKAVKVNGTDVTVTKSFEATANTMTVPVEFSIDASALAGTTTVVFETLYYGTTEIGSHKDLNDEGQTVYLPSVRTTAKDNESNTHYAAPVKDVTLVDTVEYDNLLPGKTYTITGKLVSKDTGKVVSVNGREVTVSKTFTASRDGSGSQDLSFNFDATGLTGTFVVFESISYNGVEVGKHEDLKDSDQTIMFTKILIKKQSVDADDVVGAQLEIHDANGKVIATFESTEGGNVFYRLAFDTDYTLVETKAPKGYFIADPITFRLKENGKVVVDGKEMDELIMLDDYSTGYLEITKRSMVSNKLLPGAIYGVYSDEECTKLEATIETNENGVGSVLLEHGTYWVKEVKAPTGYTFDYTIYGPFEIVGKHITESTTVYDKPTTPVPTGIIMTFWPYLVALGVVVVLLVGLAFLKKHNKKADKKKE